MRIIGCSFLVLLAFLCSSGKTARAVEAGGLQKLAQLEQRYFGHSSDAESADVRVQRLEKLVFGEASSGELDQRVVQILAATAQTAPAESSNHATSQIATPQDYSQPDVEETSMVDPDASSQADSSAGTDLYPHVTGLEKAILGCSYVGQQLTVRLSRMETKAFGKPSVSTDLSERTEALERYAEKKLHKSSNEQPERKDAAPAGASKGSDLPKQILSIVGNSLLGMAGIGPIGVGNMGPGMGPGRQAGGQHMRGAPAASPQPEPSMERHQEDQLVHAATPPPPTAKMLAKVGWCEMQLYGQTFPEMHLADRLGQLNRELNFRPGKRDLDLMDDIASLIKAVQAQKQAEQPTNPKVKEASAPQWAE